MKSLTATAPPLFCSFRTFSSLHQINAVPSPLEFRIVRNYKEFKASLQLVYNEYIKQGYLRPSENRIKLSPHHLLPTTTVFIALYNKQIVGTLSLVEDSPLGLPMDEDFKYELNSLRSQGHVLAEASMLVINREIKLKQTAPTIRPLKLFIVIQLFKIMFDYLKNLTHTAELVACFNPRHASLYDFLLLKPLGGLKQYLGANGHPALARHLNVEATKDEMFATKHPGYKAFYAQELSAKSFKSFESRFIFKPRELHEMLKLHSAILNLLSPSELAYIRSCYPSNSFRKFFVEAPSAASRCSPQRTLSLGISSA